MKSIIKKIIPKKIFKLYHTILTGMAAIYYGFPSRKMIVIGVTGTNGKSTTVNIIAQILKTAGFKVGFATTVNFGINQNIWLNKHKMTMLGRFALQKLLKDMVKNGCQYAVIETSSEGLAQGRAVGIDYDVAVFTNLTPEHLESHGGFENYKKAKAILFQNLAKSFRKKLPFCSNVAKIIVSNCDDLASSFYTSFQADKKYLYSFNNGCPKDSHDIGRCYQFTNFKQSFKGIDFTLDQTSVHCSLLGKFNAYNCAAAITVALSQGVTVENIAQALEQINVIPGRMEFIEVGQSFRVLVDYAPEPASMMALYQTINELKKDLNYKENSTVNSKVIHLLGSAGGGRDQSRRPILGQIAADNADYLVISNEDPYDEDPQVIIDQVAAGAIARGKIIDKTVFKILDREEAIKKAISLANPGDLVILTGKGAEQAIVTAHNTKIPWDERKIVKKILNEMLKS